MSVTHQTRIAATLAAFVGARLDRDRNENGYLVPRTRFVDICTPSSLIYDADVREVGPEGVTICEFGGFSRLIPWSDVQDVFDRIDHHHTRALPAESYIPARAA